MTDLNAFIMAAIALLCWMAEIPNAKGRKQGILYFAASFAAAFEAFSIGDIYAYATSAVLVIVFIFRGLQVEGNSDE